METEVVRDEIKYVWNDLDYKSCERFKLFKTIMRANVWLIVVMTFLSVLQVFLDGFVVDCITRIIRIFNPDEKAEPSWLDFINSIEVLTSLIISFQFISIMMRHNVYFRLYLVSNKVTAGLNSFIFEKVISETPSSKKDKFSQGEIINFMQVDAEKLESAATNTPTLFTIPLQLILYSAYLFNYLGYAFFVGLGTMIIMMLLNFYFQYLGMLYQEEYMKNSDERTEMVTNTVNSIKIIKMYGWEDEFLRKAKEMRAAEMNSFEKNCKTNLLTIFFMWVTPMAVSVSAIVAYVMLNEHHDFSRIIGSVVFFNLLREPMRSLPLSISNVMNTLVSTGRIEVIQ